jgi:hypothetical protein
MSSKPLPKLGRPFTGGTPRDKYLKFYLTESEMISFDRLEKELQKIYIAHGYHYNRPAHFRNFLHNLTNPLIVKAIFDNPTDELKNSKKDI